MFDSIRAITFFFVISTLNPSADAQSNNISFDEATSSYESTHDDVHNDLWNHTSTISPHDHWESIEEEARICKASTCVRKCCPEGQYFSLHLTFGCVVQNEGDPKFELQFRHKDGRPTVPDKPVHILYGSDLKICPMYGLLPEHRQSILLSDGRVFTSHDNIYRNVSRYCLDVIKRDDVNFGTWAITCYEEFQETPRTLFRYYGHATCLVLSSVSLLVIIICYVAVPKLRDLSGLCLLSYASCLLVADVTLLIVLLNSHLTISVCAIIGMVMHSSFIAAYSWLTIICFDIWRIVRMSVKGIFCACLQQHESRLFAYYSMVVWGSISVLTCITFTLQFLPQDALPDYVIRPHFGVNRCFIIEEDANLLAYFFSILAVLGTLNLIFVGMTTRYLYDGGVKLCCIKKTLPSVGDSVVLNNKDLEIFWQRFQIFAMTVVVWTAEILSWKIPPKEMWEATDLFNTLQGVVLLFIFLQSKRTRQLLLTRAACVLGEAQAEELGMGSRAESFLSTQVTPAESNPDESSR